MVPVLLLASALAQPLPLDLAFSHREISRHMRPVLSDDGRWFAYEIRTPPVKSPQTAGSREPRFLPNGLPAILEGTTLWLSDTRSGESRPLCTAPENCWRGSWSPDSRQLAYYSDAAGHPSLRVYDVATGRSRAVGDVRIKAKLWPGDEAQWSADGRTLYVPVAPPAPPAAPPSNKQTAAVTVYRTTPAAAHEASVDPINKSLLDENNATIAAVDVASGAMRVVVPFDNDERPNDLRISPDGKRIAYVTVFRFADASSLDTTHDLVVVDANDGKPQLVIKDIPYDEAFSATAHFRWLPDSQHLVYVKDKALWIAGIGERPRKLADKIALPIFLSGHAVVTGAIGEAPKLYDTDGPAAYAIVPLDGGAKRVVATMPVPIDDDRVFPPDASPRMPDDAAQRRVIAAHGNAIVIRYQSPTVPENYYLVNERFETIRRLSVAEPRLESVTVGPSVDFKTVIPAFDGKRIEVETHLFLPAGAKAGDRLPTVVFVYSGAPMSLFARNFGGGAPSSIPVQIFATRGYAVLLCDVPIGPQGKAGHPLLEMTDAIVAQVHRGAELGYVDLGRVAILGQSYGGYSAAGVITQTHLFRAAVAFDGLYDLASSFAYMDSGGATGFMWAESGQGRMGTHPWADRQRYIDNSPFYQADKIRTPLLLIHGEKDTSTPATESEKMFNALKRLGRDAELAVYAGEGHVPGRWALANAVDAAQRMLDFLARHMQ